MRITRSLTLRASLTFAVIAAIGLYMPKLPFSASSEKDRRPLPKGRIERIAFGSCAKQWQHQSIWDTVIAAKPDLFIFLGDAIYADTDGTTAWDVTERQLQGEWNRLADKLEFQKARAMISFIATWDNHDYGTHNGGVEFYLKETSKRILLDFYGCNACSSPEVTGYLKGAFK